MDIGFPELIIVLVIILLLFGSTRLPKLSRTIGESLKELRNGLSGTGSPPENKDSQKKEKEASNETKA